LKMYGAQCARINFRERVASQSRLPTPVTRRPIIGSMLDPCSRPDAVFKARKNALLSIEKMTTYLYNSYFIGFKRKFISFRKIMIFAFSPN
jgi:hypothetical protein